MPSPTIMKARGAMIDKSIGKQPLSEEEKKKKKLAKEPTSSYGPWIVALLIFVLVGSVFVQIIQHIQFSPSMSEEH